MRILNLSAALSVLALMVLLSLVVATQPGAHSDDGSNIHACVHIPIRVIKIANTDGSCPTNWTQLDWAIIGLKGDAGPDGPAGTPGDSHWQINGSSTFYNNGNVGIGSTNPAAELVVQDGRIHAGRGGADPGAWSLKPTYSFHDISNAGMTHLGTAGVDQRLALVTDAKERLVIDAASGNIGIGTASPVDKLHIVGNRIKLENSGKVVDLRVDGGGVDLESGTNSIYIRSHGVGTCPSNCNNVIINPFGEDGNVGIGTEMPVAKLEVSGGDIRVSGGSFIDDGTTIAAPDYVFEEGYPLMSLDELNEYVAREKHLPNVPSADQINRDGLNLSQFQMTLLEKIEELTLYTLSQEEKLQSLQQQISQLRARTGQQANGAMTGVAKVQPTSTADSALGDVAILSSAVAVASIILLTSGWFARRRWLARR